MEAAQKNMICPVCLEVYRSPRFLPCHHSFCLPCLEQLAKTHGNTIPCPSCREPAKLPRGGVRALKVNFYFKEEDLERARRPVDKSMCPTHPEERLTFYCTKCDQPLCLRCRLTKHDGHGAVDLSEAATRCKRTIEEELRRLQISVERITDQSESCKLKETLAKKKREAVMKEKDDN
ncbi:hypothetical protein C0Q70_03431 [Pomacea canaliculata]|uniref:RING-type domain-containing protein n=1 Tax=Pomacea canaliculata TaxID=400727 RepID=A0A2T7PST7_POMCA|nr:hypothetical protein C0Q70_03431 [Pomacea canaliculata]